MKNLLVAFALLLAAPVVVAQCAPKPGVSLGQNGLLFDDWTAATRTPVGFAFPFEGGTYTDVYITDHGMVALNTAGVPAVPAGGLAVYAPGAALLAVPGQNIIAPYWSDHTLEAALGGGPGEIFVDNISGTECTVTWADVETYNDLGAGGGSVFTVQLVLFVSGELEFRYDGRVNNDGSTFGALEAVVGIAPDGLATSGVDMTSVGFSPTSGCLEEPLTPAAATPNPLFDLGAKTLRFIPAGPGWVIVPGNSDCASHETFGASGDAPAVAGSATLSLTIPNTPSLAGAVLVAQSVGLTPSFLSLIATSNGLEGVIGY